jgi:uncharacterized Tic20 family protein
LKNLQHKAEANMRIIFTILMIAVLSVVLLLAVLVAGVDNAVILVPALLTIGFIVREEALD